ncbi:hypothetical protein BHE74_00055509 [Ensete ventricosum]|nr:hypothetical protein GW17_00051438 [Ensete ventricosum]RWW39186.1 hypothetical protein BHE74_00055509 [Ensete ventricosum]RZS17574.1 hypothetical protein BHM03_00049728 [Ensete ventricosum]
MNIQWENLKNRLMSICPSCPIPFYFDLVNPPTSAQVYLLKLFSVDRKGLLHGNNIFELLLAEDFEHGVSSLPLVAAEELFSLELCDGEFCSHKLSPDMKKLRKANVNIDNSLSPSHTLLQIQCVDQKGLLYDIMRTLKDCDIQQTDGKKIVDPVKQDILSSRLRLEMLHPMRVMIANRGPDIELLVANPVEVSGKGRPLVFYHVTLALKLLGICIFSAEIGRHKTSERQWEVYRFLLDDSLELPLANSQSRSQIVDRVRRTLMGL